MGWTVAGLLTAVIFALAAGCGANDPSDRFTGSYYGFGSISWTSGPTETLYPAPGVFTFGMRLVRVSASEVALTEWCSDGRQGPVARVNGDSTLTFGTFDCVEPEIPGFCPSTQSVQHYEGGTATLTNGTLTVTLPVSLDYCGNAWTGSFSFEGTAR